MDGTQCIHINRIDIAPEYRNKGYGTAALHKIAEAAPWRCYLAADNEDAARLYARLGEEIDPMDPIDDGEAYMDVGFGVYKII